MPATILSRRDLDFLLYEWLDVTVLTKRPRFREHSKQTFDAVLDLSVQIATKHFDTHNKQSDAHEPIMRPNGTVEIIDEVGRALRIFADAGLTAAQFDERLGGLELPVTLVRASMAWFQAANAATSSYPLLTVANANLLAAYGTEEQIDQWVRPMLQGPLLRVCQIFCVRAIG
jgi:alkylation response protein AidB-like acyl-CoA dehydrogenase